MNIVCSRNILNGAVNPALSAVSNKNTVQALDGFLIAANKDDGTLVICAYDLEKGVKVTVSGDGVKITESGSIIVNAVKFSSVIKNLPDREISVSADSNLEVNIKGNKREFTLHGLDGGMFPLMPELKGEKNLKISRKILKDMIASTIFSVAVNSSRPALNGALFEIKNNLLTVAASEGNSLSIRRSFEGLTSDESLDVSFIIPGKSLAELFKLIGEDEGSAEIELTRKHVIISFDNIVFFSRLIESEFLDYRRLIKNDAKTEVIINTQNFLESIESAAVLEDKQKTSVKLNFKNNGESGVVQITSVSSLGEVCDECDIEIDGEDLTIGFHQKYLSLALKAIKDEKIRMNLESPLRSLIIMPYDKDDKDNGDMKTADAENCKFLYVIMPKRLLE